MTAHGITPDHATVVAALRRSRRHRIRRFVLVATGLGVALAGLLGAALLLGGLSRIDPADVLPAAFGRRTGLVDYVIFQNRLPRALAAALCGALFGLSGALYQRVIRNPLATPDIVGVSGGAGAGAVAVIVLVPAVPYGPAAAALAGAFAVVGLIHLLSWRKGVDTYRLVLVGIGLSALCAACTNYLLAAADRHRLSIAMRWLIGSVHSATWDDVVLLAVALAGCAAAAALLARPLGGLALGDELAAGLGVPVTRARVGVLLLGAAAAALATSVSGPVAFVALISGPIAVRLADPRHGVALAVPVGAVIVLGADVAAQHAPLISPVPAGVLTALLGAPYFVWLLLRPAPGGAARRPATHQ